jgi:serine/threonine protein kinase
MNSESKTGCRQMSPDELFGNFEFVEAVGKGCFGRISKIEDQRSKVIFSLKKVLLDSNYHNRELSILKSINGAKNLLQVDYYLQAPVEQLRRRFEERSVKLSHLEEQELDSLKSLESKYSEVLYILTKCFRQDLRSFILKNEFNLEHAKYITKSLIVGLEGLHRLGICHRDLKSENVLVDIDKKDVVIADLGSAKDFSTKPGGISYICSRPYRAPELLLGHTEYGVDIDLWSLGCIIFEVCSFKKERLFKGKDNKEMLLQVIGLLGSPTDEDLTEMNEKRKIDVVSKIEKRDLRTLIDPRCDEAIIAVIEGLLKWSPKQRIPLKNLVGML